MNKEGIAFLVKLATEAAAEGLKFEDLEINGDAEAYIRDIIVDVGEPGMPGD